MKNWMSERISVGSVHVLVIQRVNAFISTNDSPVDKTESCHTWCQVWVILDQTTWKLSSNVSKDFFD